MVLPASAPQGNSPEPTAPQPQANQFGADFFKPKEEAPVAAAQPAPTPVQAPVTPDPATASQDEVDEFLVKFKNYFGTDPQSFMQQYSMLQEDYATRQEQAYRESLKAKLGDEGFDERYQKINERFNALPPEKQEALLSVGNLEAAILIDQALRAEQSAAAARPTVPSLDGNSTTGANPKREWRRSEIIRLTPAQYKEHKEEIDLAYAENRVIRDIR